MVDEFGRDAEKGPLDKKDWPAGDEDSGGRARSPSEIEQQRTRALDASTTAAVEDPSECYGTLGEEFRPSVDETARSFEPKERAIADLLAQQGCMVHSRKEAGIKGLTSPDAMVRTNGTDVGTLTEFKTLDSASHTAVKGNIIQAGSQLDRAELHRDGCGDVVIDGRQVGLTEDDAKRGYERAYGQAKEYRQAMPARIWIVLGDGRMICYGE